MKCVRVVWAALITLRLEFPQVREPGYVDRAGQLVARDLCFAIDIGKKFPLPALACMGDVLVSEVFWNRLTGGAETTRAGAYIEEVPLPQLADTGLINILALGNVRIVALEVGNRVWLRGFPVWGIPEGRLFCVVDLWVLRQPETDTHLAASYDSIRAPDPWMRYVKLN